MEFNIRENIKIVVDFEIGEKILIKEWGHQLDGEHIIEDIKTNFRGCASGILVKVSDYDNWIDVGWLTKISDTVKTT
jgi:hypothetical protein